MRHARQFCNFGHGILSAARGTAAIVAGRRRSSALAHPRQLSTFSGSGIRPSDSNQPFASFSSDHTRFSLPISLTSASASASRNIGTSTYPSSSSSLSDLSRPSCALLPWPPPLLKNHSSVLSGSYAFRIRCSHALRPPSAEVYYYCAGFVHPFALSFSCCYTCRLSPYLPVFPYLVFATTSSPSPHPIIPGLGLGRCLPQFHAVVSHRTVPAALPASSTVRYLHTQLNDMVHTDAFVGTSPSDAPRPSNAVGTTTALPSHTTPVISRGGSRQSVPPSFFLQKPPRTSIKSMSRLTSARRRAGWCEAEASTYGHVRRLAQRGGDQLQVPFERSS